MSQTMRGGAWFSGSPARGELGRLVEEIRKQVERVTDDLMRIDVSLFDKSLEEDLSKLYKLLVELSSRGYSGAVAYAEKARLLVEYASAVRRRMVALNTRRGLARVRDDILSHLNEIARFVERLRATLI